MKEKLRIENSNGNICLYLASIGDAARGTLLCVHGGPGGDHRGNDGIFDDIANYCGALGYNIVQFDMFGAGDSSGRPADITLKTQLEDYSSAMRFAEQHFRKPIHVVGESMGATIAALDWRSSVTSYILLWPAFDLKDTDLRPYLSENWKQILMTQGYIDDNGIILGREFIDEISSYNFAPCFRLPASPCLLVHGKRDAAVPFRQSLDAMAYGLGQSVLFAHPTGDHGLQRPEERDFTRQAVKWWLSK